MKELKDQELLSYYLKNHQIESIFNDKLMPHLILYSFDQGELICSQGDSPQYYTSSSKGN